MSSTAWRPGASLAVLQQASKLRHCIRSYMQENDVLEVVTPALSRAAATDPNIHSFQVGDRYLHTSPEFPMKRLVAAYATDIYQIATVFRDGEAGRFHNAEFSLLEWYRVGLNHVELMDDVSALLGKVTKAFGLSCRTPATVRYTDAVSGVCGKAFDEIGPVDIERVFSENKRSYPVSIGSDLDAAMDLLMDEFVVSEFSDRQPTYVVDYPASQAALAKITKNNKDTLVAERFELYWGNLELANGFHELCDAKEQLERFQNEQRIREQRKEKSVPLDEHLIDALSNGLPDCAGVALGLDRLILLISGAEHIDDVLAFSSSRA